MGVGLRMVGEAEAAERAVREDLAAVFRIADRYGWNEGVANHFSVKLPGAPGRYLVNPRGMHFAEASASRLITADAEGRVVAGEGQLRPVAFALHGSLHEALPQACCILHAHPPNATALSMMKGGRHTTAHQTAMMFHGRVVYDDAFGGTVEVAGEAERLVRLASPKTAIIVHAMHGVTALGPTVADAFDDLYFFERLCLYQLRAMSAGVPLHEISETIMATYARDPGMAPSNARIHLDAVRRLLDREGADYRS